MTSYVFLHSLVVRELSRADVASEDEIVLGHSCTNPRPAAFFQVSLHLGLSQESPADRSKLISLVMIEELHLPHPFSQVRAFSVWMLRCCCSPRRWVKDEGQ